MLKNLGASRVGVIYDQVLEENTYLQDYLDLLQKEFQVFRRSSGSYEPSVDAVDELTAHVRKEQLNLVLGVGGGSTMDVAKAVSVLLTNPGKAEEYQGTNLVKVPGVPCVTVPSVAGSGAEVSPTAVLTNPRQNLKWGINSDLVFPYLALVDPLLTMSAPLRITASSGLDALVHGLESYTCKVASPMARLLGKEAARVLITELPKLKDESDNPAIYNQLGYASVLGMMALMHSSAGFIGIFSYPLTLRFNVPHSLTKVAVLPYTLPMQQERGKTIYAEVYGEAFPQERYLPDEEKSHRFCQVVLRANEDLLGSPKLTQYGLNAQTAPGFVEEVRAFAKKHWANMENNVTEVFEDDFERVITNLY
jgi:alcohol dehydrogenase class IV